MMLILIFSVLLKIVKFFSIIKSIKKKQTIILGYILCGE
jgi:hypothetical protein